MTLFRKFLKKFTLKFTLFGEFLFLLIYIYTVKSAGRIGKGKYFTSVSSFLYTHILWSVCSIQLQNALRLFSEVAEQFPEELRSAAQYSQEIGQTDDTGKMLAMKEFVMVIIELMLYTVANVCSQVAGF